MILLLNYIWHQNKYGNMDAVRSYDEIKRRYNKPRWHKIDDIEALLYCAAMMDEEEEFWHPEKMKFPEWLKRAFGRADYDRVYNYFTEERKK